MIEEIGSSLNVGLLKGVNILLWAVCIRSKPLLFLGLERLETGGLRTKFFEYSALREAIYCWRLAMVVS